MIVEQIPELQAPKYDKLRRLIPSEQVEAWNHEYGLAIPTGTTFLDMILWLYTDSIPQQATAPRTQRDRKRKNSCENRTKIARLNKTGG